VINAEQANALFALANQGHRMGFVQQQLSQSLDSLGMTESWKINNQETVLVEGKEYSLKDLSRMLSNTPLMPGITDIDFMVKNSILYSEHLDGLTNQSFLLAKAYEDAKNKGALNNASVKKLIDTFTANIFQMSEHFEHYIAMGSSPMFKPNIAHIVTHLNSAGICQTGGGKDSGVQCQ
jgi:hypothetical protein